MGFPELHIDYAGQQSDLANAIDNPNLTYHDQTRGISYVTIAAPHLPLLMPLYRVIDQVPVLRPLVEPILKLVEPTLKVLVDLGYRRDIPVGEAVPAGLFPRLDLAKVVADLAHSVVEGVQDAFAGTPAPQSSPAASPHTPTVEDSTAPHDTAREVVKRRDRSNAGKDTAEPSLRTRPARPHSSTSKEVAAATDRPDRRKESTQDARPSRKSNAEKAGTAKMDSVRRPDRRQAAHAA
jgi:hypothetical protein